MKNGIGFLEVAFIGGIYLYSFNFWLSITLIVLSSVFKFLLYVMEWDQRRKANEKLAKAADDIGDSFKNIINRASKKHDKKTFH